MKRFWLVLVFVVVLLVSCAPAATPTPAGPKVSEKWAYGYDIAIEPLVYVWQKELNPKVEVYALGEFYGFERVPETFKRWDSRYEVAEIPEPDLPVPDLVIDGSPLKSFEKRWFRLEENSQEGILSQVFLIIRHNMVERSESGIVHLCLEDEEVMGEIIFTNELITDAELILRFVPNFRGGVDEIERTERGIRVLIAR